MPLGNAKVRRLRRDSCGAARLLLRAATPLIAHEQTRPVAQAGDRLLHPRSTGIPYIPSSAPPGGLDRRFRTQGGRSAAAISIGEPRFPVPLL